MKTLFYSIIFLTSGLVSFAQITIQTNLPPVIAHNATMNIEVKISKGAILNFAKYQMDVPAGVSMSEGDIKTGSFTFEAGRAKIVWVTIPTEPEFIVSFVMNTGTVSGPAVINQKFFYLENGAKQETEMEPLNVKFDPSGSNSTVPFKPIEGSVSSANSNTSTGSANEPTTSTNTSPETPTPNPEVKSNPPTDANATVYKLQLGAFGADPGKSKFAGAGKVTISNEAGLFKVLCGSFSSKQDALKKHEELKSKGFDSFIVAYQNGQRVK